MISPMLLSLWLNALLRDARPGAAISRSGWPTLGWARRVGSVILALAMSPMVVVSSEPTAQEKQLAEKAARLNDEAVQLHQQGRYPEATQLLQEALRIRQALYPREKYPQGHPDLAQNLNNLGALLGAQGAYGRAVPYSQQALEMRQALYPKEKYPQGHPDLAASLNTLGSLLQAQREYGRALPYLQQALEMKQLLYSKVRNPQGDAELALGLRNLGFLLQAQGDYGRALPYLQRALEMYRALYPREKFPHGHPDLARSLSTLGGLLDVQGQYARALPYYQQALEMHQALYPRDKYPHGHPDLATSLNNLGGLLKAHGEHGRALPYYQQALDMHRALYPKDKYPRGHPHLAISLNNLGSLLQAQGEFAAALSCYQQGLEVRQTLYPKDKYPHGHPEVAFSLGHLGSLLKAQGQYGKALPFYEQALEVMQTAYPKDKYPQGHPHLAAYLSGLGSLLCAQGEYGRALPYAQQTLAMRQALYPKDKYPHGHPDLAESLNNLGTLFQSQGDYGRALFYFRQSLGMHEALYPRENYPQGHPELAQSLNTLGVLLYAQGEYGRAMPYYQQTLAMRQALYPKETYQHGHPAVAASLANLGTLLFAQGEYVKALPCCRQALEMHEALYPREKYPQGHPELATCLHNLGFLLTARGEYGKALPYCQQALHMYETLNDVFLATASEAEGLNHLAARPRTRDVYLSVCRHMPDTAAASYAHVWRGKAALVRHMERRQQALLEADSTTRELAHQLARTRHALASLLLAPTSTRSDHVERLQHLSRRKEELARQLARQLPDLPVLRERSRLAPDALLAHLPPRSVFLDLLHYQRYEQDPNQPGEKGERWTECYLAFVLQPGQPVRRVELHEAAPIDQAISDWRRAIAAWRGDRPSDGAAEAVAVLHRRLWQPLAKHIPAGTETIFLAPDGPLTGLPWAALPGSKSGTILLEDHAIAVVSHGLFLLDQLRAEPAKDRTTGTLLAVGAVNYDRMPDAVAKPRLELAADRGPEVGTRKLSWPELQATGPELDRVLALAGKRELLVRRGATASAPQLLADLPQARWAHLATHGFFADPQFRSVMQLTREDYERGRRGERRGLGARNPLVLSGLVLAGANLPPKDEKDPGDRGILTAEAIAGLPLRQLDLAVLSACETGLGDVAAGEGVFGLQRAFHVAGTKNVIASLWKVDDEATAALMGLFYHKLWQENKPPLVALREAQLTLYRHPERIPVLAKERGPDFAREVVRPLDPPKPLVEVKPSDRGAVKLWAGFVLSGLGR